MDSHPAGTGAIFQFLSGLPLFAGVSQTHLAALAQTSRFKKAPKDTILFFQTDPANSVYLVQKGIIAIQLENLDGRELVINEMRPGDCFGELGVITGQPRSTSAEAMVDSEVLVIPRAAFQAVLADEPTLAMRLLEITAQRLQTSTKREEALAFHDAQQRLARLLLQMDDLASDKGYVTLSQEELAQRAGVTRQTAAAILGRWRRRGWLLTGRGHIMLLNRKELTRLMQNLESIQEEG